MIGSDGWQLSNANVLSMASQKASLEIFKEAGMANLRQKSLLMTGFLEFLLRKIASDSGIFRIITPEEPAARGAQLSLLFSSSGEQVFHKLTKNGVILDWREPDTIRVAPAPLYNTYQEVFDFYQLLNEIVAK